MSAPRPASSRPKFFNLLQIQMPVGALTSIMHRVTGLVLAIGIPLALYAMQLSLDSAESYARLAQITSTFAFEVSSIVFIWALSHHVLAGVRHLLMDVDVGSHLPAARRSAWLVNVGGVLMALLATKVML